MYRVFRSLVRFDLLLRERDVPSLRCDEACVAPAVCASSWLKREQQHLCCRRDRPLLAVASRRDMMVVLSVCFVCVCVCRWR